MLDSLWRAATTRDNFFDYVVDLFPDVVEPVEEMTAEATAQYYDSLADLPFEAIPAQGVGAEVLQANARWALSSGKGENGLLLLQQSATRQVYGASRRTVVENTDREPGARWARRARADTDCKFCKMLATRTDLYASARLAVGNGPDDRYHDNCRCLAVPVRPGKVYRPPAYVQKWEEEASWVKEA
jgi:hypothetical protein